MQAFTTEDSLATYVKRACDKFHVQVAPKFQGGGDLARELIRIAVDDKEHLIAVDWPTVFTWRLAWGLAASRLGGPSAAVDRAVTDTQAILPGTAGTYGS